MSKRSINPAADGLYGQGTYSDAGIDVTIQVRFFKLETASAAQGSMRLQVWLRHWWLDDRLRLGPGCIRQYHRARHERSYKRGA
eukprot:3310921-Prymnesium_polylepis.1